MRDCSSESLRWTCLALAIYSFQWYWSGESSASSPIPIPPRVFYIIMYIYKPTVCVYLYIWALITDHSLPSGLYIYTALCPNPLPVFAASISVSSSPSSPVSRVPFWVSQKNDNELNDIKTIKHRFKILLRALRTKPAGCPMPPFSFYSA